jgi:CO/xanthine dehydrogenase Mo-binding subunit
MIADTGAYVSKGHFVIARAAIHATGPYNIPHVRVDAFCVYTNNTTCGSTRGFGNPQANFAAERQVDEIARKLGLDPLEFRMKNIIRPGTSTATGQLIAREGFGLDECIRKVTSVNHWKRRRLRYDAFNAMPNNLMRRGIGLALLYHGNSLGQERRDYASATLEISDDGIIHLSTGLLEYGTEAATGLAMIAAEILGIRLDRIKLEKADTRYVSDSGPTVASRTTVVGGRAVEIAATKMRKKLVKVAAEVLGCNPVEIGIRDNFFYCDRNHRRLNLSKLIDECERRQVILREIGYFEVPSLDWNAKIGQGSPYHDYTYGAVLADVAVDIETGMVTVRKMIEAYDVGHAINRDSIKVIIEGGSIQGLGYGLMEELVQKDGVVLNPNLFNYQVPTSTSIPTKMISFVVEHPGRLGPFGAKAIGEIPVVIPATAIANAVAHATGSAHNTLPLTPTKVISSFRG